MPYTAGGRWVPAPGQSYAPEQPRLAGVWGEPTVDGPNTIEAGGFIYHLPALADVQIVTGARGLVFVHVKVGADRYVLAQGLQQIAEHPSMLTRAKRVY